MSATVTLTLRNARTRPAKAIVRPFYTDRDDEPATGPCSTCRRTAARLG
jgi:hypothetical protein